MGDDQTFWRSSSVRKQGGVHYHRLHTGGVHWRRTLAYIGVRWRTLAFGGVHNHRPHIGGVHWRTFLLHILLFLQVFSPEQGVSLLQLKIRRNAAGNFSSRRWRVKWYVGEECLISTTRMLCHPLPSSCRAWDEVHAEVRLFISTWFLQQICVSRCSSWNLKLPNYVRPISLLVHLWQSALLAASLCTMQPGLIDFGSSGTLSAASGMIE